MLSDKDMHKRMANGWLMGKHDGTVCGNGSTLASTANIRTWLPQMTDKYGIKSVCDAGAGDLHWIRRMEWPVGYQGFDLFPRHPDVKALDITVEPLPSCDAILCRMVLNHLWGDHGDAARVEMALDLFRQSASYLIATQYDSENPPDPVEHFYRLDLRDYLGEPMEFTQDGHESQCKLAIWAI